MGKSCPKTNNSTRIKGLKMFVAISINSTALHGVVGDITGQSKGQVFRKLVQMGLDPHKFNIVETKE